MTSRCLALLGLRRGDFSFFSDPSTAAAWFYRLCHYLAYPEMRGADSEKAKDPRHRLARLVRYVRFGASYARCAPLVLAASILKFDECRCDIPTVELHWLLALPLLGCVLMFLGLIWRRPMPESKRPRSLCPRVRVGGGRASTHPTKLRGPRRQCLPDRHDPDKREILPKS